MQLTNIELRLIGCLIEKSLTTPDQYPLSINALTNACNQKSNREPVLSLSEAEVQNTLDALTTKRLVMTETGASSRVVKYKHRFCNTEFSDLQLSPQALGIMCVLFLRGPQTPGELRTRTNRLCQFQNVQETEAVLTEMGNDKKIPLVTKLEREPGRRESRYAHLLGEQSEIITQETQGISLRKSSNTLERIKALEKMVELMQLEIDELKQHIDELLA